MIQEVLLVMPDPSREMIANVLKAAEAAGITVKVLPTIQDVTKGRTGMLAIRRAREPNIEDLLGRTPVATNLEGVRRSLAGASGARHGGRRLHRFGNLPAGCRFRSCPPGPPRPR